MTVSTSPSHPIITSVTGYTGVNKAMTWRSMPLFKRDPKKKLQKDYQQKLEAAMQAMRRGDIRENATLVAQAEALKAEIDKLD